MKPTIKYNFFTAKDLKAQGNICARKQNEFKRTAFPVIVHDKIHKVRLKGSTQNYKVKNKLIS